MVAGSLILMELDLGSKNGDPSPQNKYEAKASEVEPPVAVYFDGSLQMACAATPIKPNAAPDLRIPPPATPGGWPAAFNATLPKAPGALQTMTPLASVGFVAGNLPPPASSVLKAPYPLAVITTPLASLPATSEYFAKDTGNCSPSNIWCIMNQKCTNDLMKISSLPALIVQPLALPDPSEEPIPVLGFGKGYMMPFIKVIHQGSHFARNGFISDTLEYYYCNLGPDGMRYDASERPELCKGAVDCVATEEFKAAMHFFLLLNVPINATEAECHSIKKVISDLPEGNQAMVGLATYDIPIHNLKPGRQREAVEALIQELPKFMLKAVPTDCSECPICLEEFHVGNEVRELPCAHNVHVECIDEWLLLNVKCPRCRCSDFPNLDLSASNLGADSERSTTVVTAAAYVRSQPPSQSYLLRLQGFLGPVHTGNVGASTNEDIDLEAAENGSVVAAAREETVVEPGVIQGFIGDINNEGGGSGSGSGGGGHPPDSSIGDIDTVENLLVEVFDRYRDITYSGTVTKSSITGRSHLFQCLESRVGDIRRTHHLFYFDRNGGIITVGNNEADWDRFWPILSYMECNQRQLVELVDPDLDAAAFFVQVKERAEEKNRAREMARLLSNINRPINMPLAGNTMNQEEIDALAEYEYKLPDSSDESIVPDSSQLKCVVCQDLVKPGEIVRALPCAHQFHKVCVDIWLRKEGKCPFCRKGARQGE
ncbi:hypothetical protein Tsubulata_020834 [Turnera subulata]|uniref:RING-type domain-containing protein n=1 Tax=Turnera subulata TaxID=218843 RepID=A0A9Q0FAQ9_9ROSI|nr:hypothetical protein Tsubulata_020834 [Turnera subulata]